MLAGAQSLLVPIRSSIPRQRIHGEDGAEFCWLTREDFVRFFLNSISLFSPTPYLTITELGLVGLDALAVCNHEPALSALSLLSRVLAEQTSVAVVTDDGRNRRLIGEISHSVLSSSDETTAAALAALSAGEFVDYTKRSGALQSVKASLEKKGMSGMLELLESSNSSGSIYSSSSFYPSSSSASGSASSSSSDEEDLISSVLRNRKRTKWGRTAARKGKLSEELVVCHPESTLVAVTLQALAHRLSHVWVVDDDDGDECDAFVGVVTFSDVLHVFREHLSLMSTVN